MGLERRVPEKLKRGVCLPTTMGYVWIKATAKDFDILIECHAESGKEQHTVLSGFAVLHENGNPEGLFKELYGYMCHRTLWEPLVWCAEYQEPWDAWPYPMDKYRLIPFYEVTPQLPYQGWRTYADVLLDKRWAA